MPWEGTKRPTYPLIIISSSPLERLLLLLLVKSTEQLSQFSFSMLQDWRSLALHLRMVVWYLLLLLLTPIESSWQTVYFERVNASLHFSSSQKSSRQFTEMALLVLLPWAGYCYPPQSTSSRAVANPLDRLDVARCTLVINRANNYNSSSRKHESRATGLDGGETAPEPE